MADVDCNNVESILTFANSIIADIAKAGIAKQVKDVKRLSDLRGA